MSLITLRQATLEDLPVLQRWETHSYIVEAGISGWDWEGDVLRQTPYVENLIAELNGRPIGFLQIIDPAREPDHYWGNVPENLRAVDIFIGEPECLGKGYGTQMMHLALSQCFADTTVKGVLVDPLISNTAAHRFYKRLGFEFLETRQFGEDHCMVFILNRKQWEAQ